MGTGFFDYDGHPITLDEWYRLSTETDPVIASDQLPGGAVMTTWTGVDERPQIADVDVHRQTGDTPLIYLTIVDEPATREVWFLTPSAAEALVLHRSVAAKMRVGGCALDAV